MGLGVAVGDGVGIAVAVGSGAGFAVGVASTTGVGDGVTGVAVANSSPITVGRTPCSVHPTKNVEIAKVETSSQKTLEYPLASIATHVSSKNQC